MNNPLIDLKQTVGYLDPHSSAAKAMRNAIEEIQRLEAINAELLAALEHIVQHQSAIAGKGLAEYSGVVNIAKNAIAKAKADPKEDTK